MYLYVYKMQQELKCAFSVQYFACQEAFFNRFLATWNSQLSCPEGLSTQIWISNLQSSKCTKIFWLSPQCLLFGCVYWWINTMCYLWTSVPQSDKLPTANRTKNSKQEEDFFLTKVQHKTKDGVFFHIVAILWNRSLWSPEEEKWSICNYPCRCHSHNLSLLCTAFPSILLATHLQSLVNHSHLKPISGSSSPVIANQAIHKVTLTPHSQCLVSQLLFCCLPNASICLPTYKFSSDLLHVLWHFNDPLLLSSHLEENGCTWIHQAKPPSSDRYQDTFLLAGVLPSPATVFNKPAIILVYPCVSIVKKGNLIWPHMEFNKKKLQNLNFQHW